MPAPAAIQLARMSQTQVIELLQWAAIEGWNPGLDDAAMFYGADPEGFYMASDDNGAVAGISIVRQNDAHAFLGLYICKPEYRGSGIGLKLWQHAMQDRNGFTIALDGVVEQQDNYRKSGFEFAWRNIRYAGSVDSASLQGTQTASLHPVSDQHIDKLIVFDADIGGLTRQRFLKLWLQDAPTRKTMMLKEDNEISGLATIRQCREGFKIGPLLATNAADAKLLIDGCMDRINASSIIVDIPEPNQAGCEMAQQLGLISTFETARMYKGTGPDVDLMRLFGVASLELG